jgi:hypothetical protein
MATPSSASTPASASAADDFVIQLALDRGLLSPAQVEAARAVVAGHTDLTVPTPRVHEVLVQQGSLTARSIAELLAAEFGMAMAPDLANVRVTGDTLEVVPRAVAARHRLLPLSRDSQTLRVAISDPLDTDGIDVPGLAIVGGTIVDAGGSAVSTTFTTPANLATVLVDGVAPQTLGTIAGPGAGSYKTGDKISFTVPLNSFASDFARICRTTFRKTSLLMLPLCLMPMGPKLISVPGRMILVVTKTESTSVLISWVTAAP